MELRLVHRSEEGAKAAPVAQSAENVLRRIEWTVMRRLDGLLHGNYRTLFRGFGIDLSDLREYQVNDDARTIDWNATARLQVPHVRQFNEEREITAWFLVDLSGSVNFGSGTATKRAMAIDFVALIARLLSRHGNRVGAILYTGRRGAPRAGRASAGPASHRPDAQDAECPEAGKMHAAR